MLRRFKREGRREDEAPPVTGEPRPVQLVVGLGNVGSAYARHRHNVGFWTVNRLARRLGLEFTRRSGVVELAEGEIDGRRIILAKPRTMMNASGRAVQQALKQYNLKSEQLVVVYDELDLPAGSIRIRARGSHGGHNGMRSIVGSTGSQEFARVRIGIGRPTVGGEPTWDPEEVAAHVLSAPGPVDREALEAAAERAAEAIEVMLREGVEAAMTRYNRATSVAGESERRG